jgi:hypothetical protein
LQGYNRYSYALNNPFKYTDPSGYIDINAIIQQLWQSPYGGYWNAGDSGPTTFNSEQQAMNYVASNSGQLTSGGSGETQRNIIYLYKSKNGNPYLFDKNSGEIWNSSKQKWMSGSDLFPNAIFYDKDGNFAWEFIPTVDVVAKRSDYKITVQRIAESPDATLSKFVAFGPIPLMPVRGYMLEPRGPSTTIKNLDRRIPAGIYNVTPYYSPRLKRDVYRLSNSFVPADRNIEIHNGNFPKNTEGCLLVGNGYMMYNGNYMVTNSVTTLNSLRSLIGTNNATLTISDITVGF